MKLNKKVGLIPIGALRFRELGIDTADGTYETRIIKEARYIEKNIRDYANTVSVPPVFDRESAERAAVTLYNENVDCIIIWFASWAEDFAFIRLLRCLPAVPVMLASFVRDGIDITDTRDENQFIDFLHAGSLVGFQEASGSVARFGRPMTFTAIGTLDSIKNKLRSFIDASFIRASLRRAHIGLLSSYNEAMWSTYIDPYNLFMRIGPELHFLSVADLRSVSDAVSDAEIDGVINTLKSVFAVKGNVDHDKFRESVRVSLALEHMAHENGIDILSLNDCDSALFRHLGLRPGFNPTTPDDNTVYIPEGDLGGALAVYILGLATGQKANFIEPFYIDKKNNGFVAGHACCNYYWGDGVTIIARDERFAKSGWKHAGAPFAWHTFSPGLKTMLHMSENNGRMKMVASVVECMPTEHYLASYSHANFKTVGVLPEDFFARLAEIGVNQHYAISDGDVTDILCELSKICDFEFYKIQ